jgi:cytochrome c-type biogenesis protein CcmH
MTVFLIIAALLSVAAVLFVVRPLLVSRSSGPPAATAAMVVALGLIAIGAVFYSVLGNPTAVRVSMHASGAGTQAQNLGELARHVQDAPGDRVAWLALAQAYAQTSQYEAALHAYERANEIAGGNDPLALAGEGEALLLKGDATRVPQATALFERALQIDPDSPKGLFYGAVLAYRGGRLDVARARFAAMLKLQPPPPENVRVALTRQIEMIDDQLRPRIDAATAIHVQVKLAPKLAAKVPANAALFVFVQSTDGGPPLAVKRISAALPQEVDLSAADAMIAQRAVKPGQKVTVVARISASGSPQAHSGDLSGQIEYVAGKSGSRALEIDQLHP